MGKKIATCCYCGTRAVLVFESARHELTCSACGAPLHDMKFMPQEPGKDKKKSVKPRATKYAPSAGRSDAAGQSAGAMSGAVNRKKPQKRKKKKTFFKRLLEEIMDEIEDIID